MRGASVHVLACNTEEGAHGNTPPGSLAAWRPARLPSPLVCVEPPAARPRLTPPACPQALTLCDATGIPRDAFLAFTDAFYACRPIQVRGQGSPGGCVSRTNVRAACLLLLAGVVVVRTQGYAQRAATEAVEDGVAVELALKDVR